MPPSDPDPSDKANYSVQEIMDRLRHEGSSNSRRRRSVQQKVITKKRRRYGLLIVFLALGFILGGAVLFHMLNRSRIEGEIYRVSVGQQCSALLGATVDCDRFRALGWGDLACPNIRITSAYGGLKDALGKNLSTYMTGSSFWRDEWDIMTLTMDEAHVSFRPYVKSSPGQSATGPASLAGKDGFRIGLSAAPAAITVHDLQCANLNISWPGSGEKINRVQGLGVKGGYTQQTFKLVATGGRWTGGIWADVPVENLALTYHKDHLEIENLRVRLADKSQIRASGGIDLTPDGPSGELDVKIDAMQLTDLISPTWQRRLHGRYTPGIAQYIIRPGQPDEFSGDFTMDGLIVEKLPGLEALTKFFKSELYSKLEFRQFSGHFRRTNDSVIIEKIIAVRHGECKLTGQVEIKRDGTLSGNLRLALNTIETGLPQFAGEEDGLDLIDVTLSGTEMDPQDNLTEKFPLPAAPTPEK